VSREPQQYLDLPYHRVWDWREDDAEPYWMVRLVEIPEVVGDGAGRAEAEAALRQCLIDYVLYRQAEHLAVPEPDPAAAAG
jgi:predicted RNase H-like HicB family nuclease